MKALIVEDKAQLADAIKEYLKMKKVDTTVRYEGLEGFKEAIKGNYDVIVLDLMLPNKDGLSIIKDLRAKKIETPIIVLTAKASTEDKVECLLAGADDYLTKPFVLEELLARLLVLTRRKGNIIPNDITFADISLNQLNHVLCKGDNSVTLSLKEYQIMEIFMTNAGKIVEKSFIISKVWDSNDESCYNSAEVYISFLRKKMEAIHAFSTIRSVRNVGYKLVEKPDEE
jgi:DNA-binding response OmpR family regulator